MKLEKKWKFEKNITEKKTLKLGKLKTKKKWKLKKLKIEKKLRIEKKWKLKKMKIEKKWKFKTMNITKTKNPKKLIWKKNVNYLVNIFLVTTGRAGNARL